MVPAITGIQWVMFAAVVLLLGLLAWRWSQRTRPPKPYRSPVVSKLPPMPGSDYVAPPQNPIHPGGGWHV